MGIVRLAKCLRALNSLDEYTSRTEDIKRKIDGNRVYMDFVSIVYKIQMKVAEDLNYLLFTYILVASDMLNTTELTSKRFISVSRKYIDTIKINGSIDAKYESILSRLEMIENIVLSKQVEKLEETNDSIKRDLKSIVDEAFIENFKKNTRDKDTINRYVYESVVEFIVDMITHKLRDVEYVLISFDGIPSFGKVQEQRQRRYMRYTYLEFQKLINKNTDQKLPDNYLKNLQNKTLTSLRDIYDIDHFYVDIKTAIEYVYSRYHTTELQKDITSGVNEHRMKTEENKDSIQNLIVDVIDKPYGEGEKILMDKLIQDFKQYGNEKSYVFYSPDGDSVILCLYIHIKTKMEKIAVVKTYSTNPSERHNEQSQYVDSKTLYNNIVKMVQTFNNETYDKVEEKDNICTDFIFMINLFGNDFIHQIPTLEISTTFNDLMYIYSKFLTDSKVSKKGDSSEMFITRKVDEKVHINYPMMIEFFNVLAEYEQYMMLDTYLLDVNDKNRITKTFGIIFPCMYLLDYREKVYEIKRDLHEMIIAGETNIELVKAYIVQSLTKLNEIKTVTNKQYGDIWMRIEIKNVNDYAGKVIIDPNSLLTKEPRFIYGLRPKRNKDETTIRKMIDDLEKDLLKTGESIDVSRYFSSNDKKIQEFAFDYSNLRTLVPHNQMPTTDADIDLYLLEWKAGRWMDIMNAKPFELGYDWRKERARKIDQEMKRYQYDVIGINNTQMTKMVVDYLRTLSWMVDYYMNTDYESTSNEISTWSFNYDRSPFINHIKMYLEASEYTDVKNIMKGFYKRSLIPVDRYIKSDKHRFYIYPQTTEIIQKIPAKFKQSFPDMLQYIEKTLKMAEDKRGVVTQGAGTEERVFDCRMCPYFSKCVFKNRHMTFNDLMELDVGRVLTNVESLNKNRGIRSNDIRTNVGIVPKSEAGQHIKINTNNVQASRSTPWSNPVQYPSHNIIHNTAPKSLLIRPKTHHNVDRPNVVKGTQNNTTQQFNNRSQYAQQYSPQYTQKSSQQSYNYNASPSFVQHPGYVKRVGNYGIPQQPIAGHQNVGHQNVGHQNVDHSIMHQQSLRQPYTGYYVTRSIGASKCNPRYQHTDRKVDPQIDK